MANLASLTIDDTSHLTLSKGTTAQRPASPSTGLLRYNTDRKEIEFYNGSVWVSGVDRTIATVGAICYLDPGNSSSYGGSGTTLTDISGYGNNGTINGSVTFTASKGFLTLDGTSQYVSTSVTRGTMGRDCSWTIWARYAGLSADGYRAMVGGVGSNIFMGKDSGNLNLGLQDGNYISSFLSSSATAKPFDGNWHYFVYTHEDGVGKLYVDGYLLSMSTYTRAGDSENLRFGVEQEGSGYYWKGDIGPMALYNKALNKREVVRNYNLDRLRFGV